MLKKTGIVVASITAGLLALSPLAFATDDKDHDDKSSSHYDDKNDDGSGNNNDNSLVGNDIADSSINNCENNQNTDSADDGTDSGSLVEVPVDTLNDNNVNALQCTNILNNFLNDNTVNVDLLSDDVTVPTS